MSKTRIGSIALATTAAYVVDAILVVATNQLLSPMSRREAASSLSRDRPRQPMPFMRLLLDICVLRLRDRCSGSRWRA